MVTLNQKARPVVRCYGGGPFGQNGYVVSCSGGTEAILIDPGSTTTEMLRAVERERLSVGAIVVTHAHIDHVEGLAEAKRDTGAPILLHRDDALMYRQIAVQAQMFGVRLEMPPPIDEYLVEGTPVKFGRCELEVRHTPGHAPGHVILVGDGIALVGDCVFAGSIGRTDLPGGDFQTLMTSIRGQILTLPDETILYTGHGQETTVGHERVANPFLVPQLGGSRFA